MASAEPSPGDVLDGRYRLERQLGEGGIGTVWEAVHLVLDRRVAVKLLHPKYARDGELLLRFRREAESAARLGHPNIVDVLDFAAVPGAPAYMVMELLRGDSLRGRIEREAPLPAAAVVTMARQALDALAAAHAAGVVHRDLKPDNIFLAQQPDGSHRVKLVDFGLARVEGAGALTKTGTTVGTPLYMPPEQARGSKVDHRADLWALAASLYEALTGRPPFEAKAYGELVAKIVSQEPVSISALRSDVPPALLDAIDAAMVKDLNGRVASARDMRAIIDAGHTTADEAQQRAALAPTMMPSPRFSAPAPRQHATPGKQQIAVMMEPGSLTPPRPREATGTPRPGTRRRGHGRLLATVTVITLLAIGGGVAALVALAPDEPDALARRDEAVREPSAQPPVPEPEPVAPLEVHPALPAGALAPGAVQTPEGDEGTTEEAMGAEAAEEETAARPRRARTPREESSEPAERSTDDEAAARRAETSGEERSAAGAGTSAFASSVQLVGVTGGSYDTWSAESHLGTAERDFVRCVAGSSVPPGRSTFTLTLEADGSVSRVDGTPEDARQCLWRAVRSVPWMPPPTRISLRATYRFVQ